MSKYLRPSNKLQRQINQAELAEYSMNLMGNYPEHLLAFAPPGVADFIGAAIGNAYKAVQAGGIKNLTGGTIGLVGGALAGTGLGESEEERRNTNIASRASKIVGGALLGTGAGALAQAGGTAAVNRFRKPAPGAAPGAIPQPGAAPAPAPLLGGAAPTGQAQNQAAAQQAAAAKKAKQEELRRRQSQSTDPGSLRNDPAYQTIDVG